MEVDLGERENDPSEKTEIFARWKTIRMAWIIFLIGYMIDTASCFFVRDFNITQ